MEIEHAGYDSEIVNLESGKVKTAETLSLEPKREFGMSRDQVELIERTVALGATDDELQMFIHAANKSGLDPLMRQIHFVKRSGKATIQCGIDGYRLIADRTGKYAGNDDPIFDSEQKPTKATVTVYKIAGGVRCPFTATARWDQYFPGETQGFMWRKMPHLMLGKCAEALALRKAFPAELSGLYTHEEMQQADRAEQAPIAEPRRLQRPQESTQKAPETPQETTSAVALIPGVLKTVIKVDFISQKEGISKTGKNAGKTYVQYGVTGDDTFVYSTFDEKFFDLAAKAKEENKSVEIEYREKEFKGKIYRTIVNLKESGV